MTRMPAVRLRLQTQLLILLLVFGVVPVVIVVISGYSVSRRVLVAQSEVALHELVSRQSSYLRTEIRREQLILRTIAGQLAQATARGQGLDLHAVLLGSLADDGVFDGLRIVDDEGRSVSSVALREIAPDWPERDPSDVGSGLTLHLREDRVIAYMLTAPVTVNGRRRWLQGHVRAEDFARNFDIPLHLLGGVEIGVFDEAGHAVLVPHTHAASELRALMFSVGASSNDGDRVSFGGRPALGFATAMEGFQWTIVAALPLEIVLAPVNRLLLFAVLGGVALTLLVVMAGHTAARFVTTPLRELSDAASTFGATGSFDSIRHRGVTETQTLIESFQEMTDNLRRSRREIEQLHDLEMERAQQLATVGELASGVAHEIRNPLTGVLGALEVIRRRMPRADKSLPLLDEAHAQLDRIESTTGRLLEYARPPVVRRIDIDLVHVIERASRVVQSTGEKARVTLDISVPSRRRMVHADPELLVQVMVNLFLNGIEASPDGSGLQVRLLDRSEGIEVRVVDHGAGVTSDHRQEIFRPFYTTKHQGTGLGLSISRQIVMRHDGSMWVEETPGGGATFVMLLPTIDEKVHDG